MPKTPASGAFPGNAVRIVLLCCLAGPASAQRASAPNPTLFDPDHVFDIRIELPTADWDRLRRQGHDFSKFLHRDRLDEWLSSPYSYFKADVTIDGTRLRSVGVRKKGFLGSVNTLRPSLKIKLDEYVGKQRFLGTSRLTLQNNHTDKALVSQALACSLYQRAGLPAPRCGFARVTVNGVYLGVYTHIESLKKPFLRRTFGDDSGNLYEGRLSDFRPDFVDTFQVKTNKKRNDRSDLARVVRALQAAEPQLLTAVGAVVDIDRFLDFWSLTSLIQFWDSYPGAANNFFCYNNPRTGKFEFIPWAPDSAFRAGWFALTERPRSVYAEGYLAHQLYRLPEIRTRYRQAMRKWLDGVWSEPVILAELDRMVELLKPHSHLDAATWTRSVDQIRARIRARRAEVTAELEKPLETWPFPPQSGVLWNKMGTVHCRFSFDRSDPTATGKAELTIHMDGEQLRLGDASLLVAPRREPLPYTALYATGVQGEATRVGFTLPLTEQILQRGGTFPVDGNRVTSWLFRIESRPDGGEEWRGYGLNLGQVTLRVDGTTVHGTLRCDTLRIPIH